MQQLKRYLKKSQTAKIIYREFYNNWQKKSIKIFSFYLKQIKLGTITRDNLIANREKYKLQYFAAEEILNLGDFYTPKPTPDRIASRIYAMKEKIARPFVCEIENAEIIGNYPVAFDREGSLILETTLPRFTSVESHVARHVSIKTIIASRLKPKSARSKIDFACILTNPWSNNFWHWTVDTLTQLEGIEYYRQITGIKPKLIVDRDLRSWQRDSLKLLGYNENDLIYWQDFRRAVNKLIVPSFRRSYHGIHGEISVSACQWLKQTMLNNICHEENNIVAYSPKIFISRRKALGRRISNETEVIEALTPLGFTAYVLEEMSYIEQVKLFAKAQVIVAPHGAGLTNLIFADKPIILELFGAYVGREFANLARAMGFKYGCLGCSSSRGEVRQKDGDMVVDVKELVDLLEEMEA